MANVGSSRSNFNKGLIQPAHDWCMSVLRLIPMDGRSVTTGLKGRSSLFSFDFSSATDRFPLAVQGLIIEAKFNRLTAFAWVACGLGTNVFSCQTSRDSRRLGSSRLIRFATGQPLGFLSSWPLFALCHHFIVWYCAEKVYPNRVFKRYALLGDDLVIGDERVAEVYRHVMDRLGVKISLAKTLTSDCGGLEFAKKFRIHDRELSPLSLKMIRSIRFSVALMPVLKSIGIPSGLFEA